MTYIFFRQLMLSIFTDERTQLITNIMTIIENCEEKEFQNFFCTYKYYEITYTKCTMNLVEFRIRAMHDTYSLEFEMRYSDEGKKSFFNKRNIITSMKSN